MRAVAELAGVWRGDDVWIIGSGPTMNHVDPNFFWNKKTIGVNWMFRWFPVDVTVCKENYLASEAIKTGVRFHPDGTHGAKHHRVVYSRFHTGNRNQDETAINAGNAYCFDHPHNQLKKVELNPIGVETEFNAMGVLVVSYSTITTAIHLAAFMGAENIILCGHDCGTLDGQINFRDYPPTPAAAGLKFYAQFVREIEPQTAMVRDALRSIYGVNIYSLNPFLNLGLEGRKYE